MRLHALEITAFGPFAETVTIDFDTLSEASVFLFCGDTGAGKTTVLDAICFAFYGDVPNERSRAKQLRSQHASAGAAPRVVLEATVAGRRLRFTRSPAWQRSKKRGTGTTTEQARVLVEELLAGAWRSRTNRLDEAGHLVSDLLGMTLSQFSQVVLLPQGQFDTFLRSSSEERHALLTQLFRTSRFEDVERWLAERRTTLRRLGETHREAVTALLHRVSEATGSGLPGWSADVLSAADDGSIETWTAALGTHADTVVQRTRADLRHATAQLRTSGERLEVGRRLAELRTRHDRAVVTRDRLLATADDARSDVDALDRARRAAVVAPLARISDEAHAVASSRAATARIAMSSVSDLLSDPADEDTLAAGARDASAQAAVARSFLPRARALARTEARIGQLDARRVELEARRAGLVARADSMAALIGTLGASVTRLRTEAEQLPQARLRVGELGRLVSQFAVLDELAFQVADFSEKRDQQRLLTVGLRERLADVREQRLHAMASELAAALAVGGDCPVCGSLEHPSPARPAPGSPTRLEERALRDQVDTAEVLLETHRDQVRGYQARLEALRAELGARSLEQTLVELTTAETALQTAAAAAKELAQTETELASVRTAEKADVSALAELDADQRVVTEQHASALQSVAEVSRELSDLLGEVGDANDLMSLVQRSERAATLLSRAGSALAEQTDSEDRAARALEAAETTSTEHGFTDLLDARTAILSTSQVGDLEGRVATRLREETQAAAVLGDPDIQASLRLPPPDLDALTRSQDEAAESHTTAASITRAAELRRTQLGDLATALHDALLVWRPLRDEYAAVRALAEFVEGKGAENTRQMRLSAYVLASRLAQVVAAANERLGRMTDHRYALAHTSDRGVGERRGGLSLLVRDQWTDDLRDPVTLSGGETFVVSLALALGLADVVTGEAGGARIETLFVDEGFGSLDGDTLELVMDTLDQLRESGRVVGVVSHVPELRNRIPAQLVVHKTRAGSTVSQDLAH